MDRPSCTDSATTQTKRPTRLWKEKLSRTFERKKFVKKKTTTCMLLVLKLNSQNHPENMKMNIKTTATVTTTIRKKKMW